MATNHNLKKCKVDKLKVVEDLVLRSHSIKYLGVHLDEHLNFKLHITKKCQTAMQNYFKIRSIRHPSGYHHYSPCLCLSLCILHLDYCNSVLYGLPDTTRNKLQRVQNMCSTLSIKMGGNMTVSWSVSENCTGCQ